MKFELVDQPQDDYRNSPLVDAFRKLQPGKAISIPIESDQEKMRMRITSALRYHGLTCRSAIRDGNLIVWAK